MKMPMLAVVGIAEDKKVIIMGDQIEKKPKGWKDKWPPTGVGSIMPCLTTADCYCWQHPAECCELFPGKCKNKKCEN